MTLFARITLALLIALPAAACGGKKDDKPTEPAPAADEAKADEAKADEAGNTTAKVGLDTGGKTIGGEKVALDKMTFGGSGFDAEFNEALDSWTVEKWVPNEDGGNDMVVRVYVDAWNEDWPADHAAFGEKLKTKDFLDMGSSWTVDKSEAFEGGWVVMGASSDGEDTEMAFAVRIDKANALCRGYVQVDVPEDKRAEVRDDAIAGCKGITLP